MVKKAVKVGGGELGKLELYRLTADPATESVQMHAGELIKPTAYAVYDDAKDDKGNSVEVLSFTDGDFTYSTISSTFKREFLKCAEIADTAPFEIEIMKGVTKAGRAFMTCRLTWIEE